MKSKFSCNAVQFIGLSVLTLGLTAVCDASVIVSAGGTPDPSAGMLTSVVGANTINFDNGENDPAGIATLSGGTLATTSIGGQAVQPSGDSTQYIAVENSRNTLVINFSQPISYFGLYWGSPDFFNVLNLNLGGSTVDSFTGTDLSGSSDAYINFTGNAGETFDQIVITSNQAAFELDNVSYQVAATPEPATLSMFLIGSLLCAFSVRKRVAVKTKR